MRFTEKSKWCLLKNVYQVMRDVLQFIFCPVDSDLPFFEFLFDNAKNDSIWYHMQVKQGDTPAKCYFPAFFKMVSIPSTGAGIWMKMVEMEENGI